MACDLRTGHGVVMQRAFLHLIMNGSRSCLEDCLQFAGNDDSIILLASAVDLMLDEDACQAIAQAREGRGLRIAFRAADVQCRGLSGIALSDKLELLEDEAWVRAVCDHSEILSWS